VLKQSLARLEHYVCCISEHTGLTNSNIVVRKAGMTDLSCQCMQGDLSRKEWVAPALSPLTEGAGGTSSAGTGQGFGAAISNAVEGAKGYLPPQV